VLKRRTVNFSWRTGLANSSHAALDRINTRRVRIIPKSIGSTGDYHTTHFRLKNLLTPKTRRVSIRLSNAKSQTVKRRSKKRRAIERR
jgi:hypothetical protein